MSHADEIKAIIERRIEALRRRDAAAANAALDKELVAFEVAGPLRLPAEQATDAATTQAWLDSFDEGPTVTMEELTICADAEVAFCHSLNRIQGRRVDGQSVDVMMRSTLGLRKRRASGRLSTDTLQFHAEEVRFPPIVDIRAAVTICPAFPR